MVFNSDPGEGTSDGRVKRKRKQKPSGSKIKIKIENDVKAEPRDDAYLVQCSPPPSPIEASGTIKSESGSDDELDLKSEPDYVETEIKTEKDECSKKKYDAPQDGNSNNNASDDHDGTNGANPNVNVNGNEEQHQSKPKATKKRGTKKNDSGNVQIDPAEAKYGKKHKCNLCSYSASYKYILM
ncbi:uncharacterized protein LOC116348688, partial [Contarinia nasturtii]|uniref:uncharacterized protein LOC116348688 n=1 Tax=Contarinia nasturtii TaxID=265458 RepID=UPI0012D378F8